jgi:hypothetical protein
MSANRLLDRNNFRMARHPGEILKVTDHRANFTFALGQAHRNYWRFVYSTFACFRTGMSRAALSKNASLRTGCGCQLS